jgi:hypothetical protein
VSAVTRPPANTNRLVNASNDKAERRQTKLTVPPLEIVTKRVHRP